MARPRVLGLSAESRLRASWMQPCPSSAGAPVGGMCGAPSGRGVWGPGLRLCSPVPSLACPPPARCPSRAGTHTPCSVGAAVSELPSWQGERLGRISTNRNNDPPKKNLSLYDSRSMNLDPGKCRHREQASVRWPRCWMGFLLTPGRATEQQASSGYVLRGCVVDE